MVRALKCTFLAAVVCFALAHTALAFDNDDLGVRFSDVVLWNINAKWNMYLYQEFNLGDDGGHFYCQVHEAGATYSGLAKWFDATLAYAKVYFKSKGEWFDENVPWLAGTVKFKVAGWDISDKNRFEYDRVEKTEGDWNYRNYITITPPIKFTRFEIQPYAADEIFYNFDEDYVTRNEFRSGVNFKIIKNVSGGIYYLLGHSHNNVPGRDYWVRAHVIATTITVSF